MSAIAEVWESSIYFAEDLRNAIHPANILVAIVTSITATIIVFLCTRFWNNTPLFSRFWKKVYSLITRKKYLLFWMDDMDIDSDAIIKNLKARGLEKCHFRNLPSAKKFLTYPQSSRYVNGIALIATDVTKLSDNPETRRKIQSHILTFVKKGGVLIGTHDVIYRRMGNTEFEKKFGYQTSKFERSKQPIKYTLNPEFREHPLLEGLDNVFMLNDLEVCYGDILEPDCLQLATCEVKINGVSEQKVTLMTRNVVDGVIIWINSWDKQVDDLYTPYRPEDELLVIFKNAILAKKAIIQYNEQYKKQKSKNTVSNH